ncbi:MAG: hypothetical protein N2Z20_04275 [Elusimicrobiales bacterium]|nr:hypothetical protein [Elusimicrobiales bacterium]
MKNFLIILTIFNFYFSADIYCGESVSSNFSFENNRTSFPFLTKLSATASINDDYRIFSIGPGGNILYQPDVSVTFLKNLNFPYISYELKLSTEIEKMLYEYDSYLKPLTYEDYSEKLISLFPTTPYNTPSIVIGDFNGDNKEDILMRGKKFAENKHIEKEILIISTNSAYAILTLKEGEYFPGERKDINPITYPHIRMGKRNTAYLFQPRGSKYICGGDYSKRFKTLPNDGYAMVEITEDKLHFNVIYQWNTNTKEFEQYCVDMEGYYYIPMYISLKKSHYEYYKENLKKSKE